MKRLALLLGLVAFCAGEDVLEDILRTPGNNSHYVEGASRYIWMPDAQGNDILVDLHEPVEEMLSENRNGARNAYWLFTRRNPTSRQILTNGNVNSVRNSNYAGNRATKVIVHGWTDSGNSAVNTDITAAFLAQCDCNVIVVDWSAVAGGSYNSAVRDVPSVGQHLGNFIIWLFNNAGGNFNNLHLTGHSLGAHVIGNAGRTLGRRARRVTGLDPAGPQWGGNPNALNRNSGGYVEAIHTDGRALGIMDAIAHGDFYPNGGRHPQPGCRLNSCSHGRATTLFASTVRFNRHVARQCINIAQAELSACNGAALNLGNNVMGKTGNGLFGLRTGSSWPY